MQTLSCDLWVIEDYAFRQFKAIAGGLRTLPNQEQARAAAAVAPRTQKTIGIIPVHGVLEARPSFIGEMFGMTSYERIGNAVDTLMADESVTAIVMDVASPGGMVYGAQELAQKIYSSRGKKPIIAVANPMAASGAFWISSAADRVVVTPSGDTGSVGVIAEHVDISKALESQGETVTTIRSTASPFKGEGSDTEPLSDQAKAHMQSRADAIYQQFAGDLARFRGVSVEHVNAKFGQGRVVASGPAMAAKMVDRVDTLQGVVMKLMEGRIRLGGNSAQDQWEIPTPRELRRERVAAIQAALTVKENENGET